MVRIDGQNWRPRDSNSRRIAAAPYSPSRLWSFSHRRIVSTRCSIAGSVRLVCFGVGGRSFQKVDDACAWPEGANYTVRKLTGLSGKDYWEGCSDDRDNDGDGRVDFDPVTYADPGDQWTLPAGSGDPACFNPSWYNVSA